jgi:dipeptidyl aminopeptidase/acylaminoacyl peptidase
MKKYQINDFLEVKSAGASSFNFDGSKVSFLSNITGTRQIYLISKEGGEAEQLTSYEDPVSFAVFSPIEDIILFGKASSGNEQTQLYMYSLETKQVESLLLNEKVQYNFGQFSRDGKYISYSHNERNGKDFDVCIMNLETREIECVFDKGGRSFSAGFSPCGTYLGVKKSRTNLDADLYLITRKDKSCELLTEHEGQIYFSNMVWLPDDSGFYTITNKERDFMGLAKYHIESKELAYVLTPEWDVDGCTISQDGSLLSVIVNEDGYNTLSLLQTNDLSEITLTGLPKTGMVYSVRFSKDSKYLSLVIGDATHTADIWIYSLIDNVCTQLTWSKQGVPAEELVEPTLFRYTSFDGLSIPAFLYMPKDAQGKVPVVVSIHGGPEAQYTPSLALLTQYFVYQGYAVIAPNVRGSSGYGKKYLGLDDIEKRLDSVHDLATLHGHIKTIPQLDADKVVLMGGSYGGYMTLAGLAFYPDLWVGGVDIVGIANFVTFLENTAPYRRAVREAEYGYLDKHRELLHSISPINHVDKIKAPLFVIHGANDPRVPLDEAQQMVSKLSEIGRRAELLVYADEGHGLSKLKNRLDAYPKVAEFLKTVFSN